MAPPEPSQTSLPPNQPALDDIAGAIDGIGRTRAYRATYCSVELDDAADLVTVYTTTGEAGSRLKVAAERTSPRLHWSKLRLASARYPVAPLIARVTALMFVTKYHLVTGSPDPHCAGLQFTVDKTALASGAVPSMSRLRATLEAESGFPVELTSGSAPVGSGAVG